MEIKIRNLTKKFDDVTAINNLNIDISEGVTGLMGENGAGKSTLFRLISDVIYPNSGEILIDNEPARTKHAKESISSKDLLLALLGHLHLIFQSTIHKKITASPQKYLQELENYSCGTASAKSSLPEAPSAPSSAVSISSCSPTSPTSRFSFGSGGSSLKSLMEKQRRKFLVVP